MHSSTPFPSSPPRPPAAWHLPASTLVRTGAVLGVLVGIVAVIGWLAGQELGLAIAATVAAMAAAALWWFSDRLALRTARARPLGRDEAPQVHQLLGALATRGDLAVPRLYVSPNPQPNAFATGRTARHATVTVTQGLIDLLPPHEVRGVLAHELAHVHHHDVVLTSVVAAVTTSLMVVANLVRLRPPLSGHGDHERRGPLCTLALILMAPAARLCGAWVMTAKRELRADALGARWTDDPRALANAVARIDAYSRLSPMPLPAGQGQAWIVNPVGVPPGFSRWYSTHPPIDQRLAALSNHALKRSPT